MKRILYGAAILLALGGAVRGSDAEQFFLRSSRRTHDHTTLSPRARALGGSFAALSNGASGVVENPAGLGAQTNHEVVTDIGLDEIDEDGGYATVLTINAGGAMNLNAVAPAVWPRGQWYNHTVGFMIHRDSINFDDADALESDITAFTLAWGRSFYQGQYFGGLALNYSVGNTADDATFDRDWYRWELKAGGMARLTERFTLGALVAAGLGEMQDNGPFDPDGDTHHFELRGGVAYEANACTLLVGDVSWRSLEISQEDFPDQSEQHSLWRVSAGVENVVMPDELTLRGGLYYERDSFVAKRLPVDDLPDDYFGFTLGASYFPNQWVELGYTLDVRTTSEVANTIRVGVDW